MSPRRRWSRPERAYRDVWLVIITVLIVFLGIKALDAATTARQATREIQAQRINTILTSCREQNRRHDATDAKLDLIIHRAELKSPRLRLRLEASRVTTKLLIDQLAPKQDCKRVVSQATRVLPPIQRQYPPVFPTHH